MLRKWGNYGWERTDFETLGLLRYIGGLHALFQKQDLFKQEGITRKLFFSLLDFIIEGNYLRGEIRLKE